MSTEKHELFAQSMDANAGPTMLFVDARHPRVQVPEEYKTRPILPLSFAWRYLNFACKWDTHALQAYLTFKGVGARVVIPWEAVVGMKTSDGRLHRWDVFIPAPLVPFLRPKKNHLRLVKNDECENDENVLDPYEGVSKVEENRTGETPEEGKQ